ncbi:MAG: hypothetical protein WBV78_01815 [Roseobacter sp.]
MSTLNQIKCVAERSRSTLVQDALGASALMVMLIVGLHIPSFF